MFFMCNYVLNPINSYHITYKTAYCFPFNVFIRSALMVRGYLCMASWRLHTTALTYGPDRYERVVSKHDTRHDPNT
jgi:hypothetical protein